ncbi:MAG TPA: hypothetical protein VE263_09975 [Candidatus Angelobacter sp.]|nr:hypothetical protein [Candidatus Angelobacter sp.]
MEIRNSGTVHLRTKAQNGRSDFGFRISIFVFLIVVGCGAPGEPVPPAPPVPVAVADLSARQSGDGVELLFTLPSKSIRGDKLASYPAIEILRGAVNSNGAPDAKSFRVVYTIPGAMVDNYRVAGRVRFTDPISPEETKAHPGGAVAYVVRTRVSSKRASADSNVVAARVFPVAEIVSAVQTHLTEQAIELRWPAPTRTSAGDALPAVAAYHVYRGEIAAGTSAPTSKELVATKWIALPALLATVNENSYRDTQFEFGKTYVYVVRTLIVQDGAEIESDASEPATVAAIDTFPPAAPQGLVAAVLPGATAGAFVIDLSWSLNVETDLAGYRVYRSEQEGTRGQLVTPDLLPTPSVRDNSVEPGRRYWYTVTAVDRAGNESPPSTPVAVDIAQPSP